MSTKQTRGTVDPTKLSKLRGDRSLREVSSRANVSEILYAEIENGTRSDPPVSAVYRIATALEVKIEELLRESAGAM
jgi:transcriptional regulator with XRE-family HTH domain